MECHEAPKILHKVTLRISFADWTGEGEVRWTGRIENGSETCRH